MSIRKVLSVALLAAFAIPVAAKIAAESCCYGTICPLIQGCTRTCGSPYNHTCKHTCTPPCDQGQGCCDFDMRNCTYSGSDYCNSRPACVEIINPVFSSTKYCRDGANQVPCLETSASSCAP